MADCSACATARPNAAHRCAPARNRRRSATSGLVWSVPTGVAQSDWIIGRNVQIDTRWATANPDAVRRHAAELAALAPDVILASGASTVGPLLQVTRTVPIVFAAVADPVGAGFVNSLARPGGNTTGFMAFEYSISGKWLELLKQIAPSLMRVAILQPQPPGSGSLLRSSPWRRRSEWSCARLTCARLVKSSALSRRSQALRMAV